MQLSHRAAAKKQLAAEGQREVVKYLHFEWLCVVFYFFSMFLNTNPFFCCWCSRSRIKKTSIEIRCQRFDSLPDQNKIFLNMPKTVSAKLPACNGSNSSEHYFAEEYLNFCHIARFYLYWSKGCFSFLQFTFLKMCVWWGMYLKCLSETVCRLKRQHKIGCKMLD